MLSLVGWYCAPCPERNHDRQLGSYREPLDLLVLIKLRLSAQQGQLIIWPMGHTRK